MRILKTSNYDDPAYKESFVFCFPVSEASANEVCAIINKENPYRCDYYKVVPNDYILRNGMDDLA